MVVSALTPPCGAASPLPLHPPYSCPPPHTFPALRRSLEVAQESTKALSAIKGLQEKQAAAVESLQVGRAVGELELHARGGWNPSPRHAPLADEVLR